MVIDTSAVLAILFDEPEADDIEMAIDADPVRLISAASYLETAIVVESRLGEPLLFKGDDFGKTDIPRVVLGVE